MMVDCGLRMFRSVFAAAEVSRLMSVARAGDGANGGGGATRYVIVGAGPAGVAAAETLAAVDPGSSIRLIGDEKEPPYSRMAIPYVLTGLIGEDGTYLRKKDGYYDRAGVAIQHATVKSVDAKAKILKLSGGKTCGYDKLLIATGASPVKPPIDGLDLPGVHHCWTLEDARGIAARAAKGASVVLMGAGFIGCIILQALAQRKTKLTVVEALDRMVPRMMNETGGNLIKQWCESRGIAVHTSTKVARLSDGGKRIKVELDNGKAIDADLVVVATGVASNTGFLKGSGVEIDQGIKVDNHLQSSVADIYAAGDCAQGPDFSTGGWSVHAIQPTAAEHGRIAALNMAGREARYKGSLNMNVLDTAGLISASFGSWDGVAGGSSAEALDAERYRYMRLEFDAGDHLVGALSLGRTDHIGILRGLIQTRISLGPWKEKLVHDPNRIVEAYVARTQ
ncbi:MAG TPA: FAD-dependent oxidoreductase [Kiloniellales bacterium]